MSIIRKVKKCKVWMINGDNIKNTAKARNQYECTFAKGELDEIAKRLKRNAVLSTPLVQRFKCSH
jgi:hypothetical protein